MTEDRNERLVARLGEAERADEDELVLLVGAVQRPLRDPARVEARSQNVAEGLFDVLAPRHRLRDPREDRELGSLQRRPFRGGGVGARLPLQLFDDAFGVLLFRQVRIDLPLGPPRDGGTQDVHGVVEVGGARHERARTHSAREILVARASVMSGDEDHGDARQDVFAAKRDAQLVAVGPWHEDVAEDHVGNHGARALQGGLTVAGGQDPEPRRLEPQPRQLQLHRIVVDDENRRPGLARGRCLGGGDERTNRRHELRDVHRLDQHVVERARLDARLIEEPPETRDRHDRQRRAPGQRPQHARQSQPLHIGQDEILQDQVRKIGGRQRQRTAPVLRLEHAIALRFEGHAKQLPRRRIVLDDEDAGCRHTSTSAGPASDRYSEICSGSFCTSMGFAM